MRTSRCSVLEIERFESSPASCLLFPASSLPWSPTASTASRGTTTGPSIRSGWTVQYVTERQIHSSGPRRNRVSHQRLCGPVRPGRHSTR